MPEGNTVIIKTILKNLFFMCTSWAKWGADIKLKGSEAFIRRIEKLTDMSWCWGYGNKFTFFHSQVLVFLEGLMVYGIQEVIPILKWIDHIDCSYQYIKKTNIIGRRNLSCFFRYVCEGKCCSKKTIIFLLKSVFWGKILGIFLCMLVM